MTQKIIRITVLTTIILAFAVSPAFANNLDISGPILKDIDTTNDTIDVQFDITWENSWRDAENYDAVWVFMKYSTDAGATWSHLKLESSGINPSRTIPKSESCVISITGNGLKTQEAVTEHIGKPYRIKPTLESFEKNLRKETKIKEDVWQSK